MSRSVYIGIDDSIASYTPAVRVGDLVFVSGHVAIGDSGEIVDATVAGQARHVLTHMRATLAAAGAELSDLVWVAVHLRDASAFSEFEAVYKEFFSPPFPARRTVVSQLVIDGLEVEISGIAHSPQVQA